MAEEDVERLDKDNVLAQRLIGVAEQLGIDPSKEFFLLPIAKHAMESPREWADGVDGEGMAGERGEGGGDDLGERGVDLSWFKKLVETERARYKSNPVEASPWLKLTEEDGTTYYYNFKTHRRSSSLPGYRPRTDVDAPRMDDSDLEVMRFVSWWTENGEKRYVRINYYLRAEEFEIDIDRDESIYRVKTLKGKFGPATCWDLHIGCYVTVFGRNTTLMQCDHDTRKWIEANAKRLLAVKAKLETTLSKYEKIPQSRLPQRPLVERHLRAIMNQMTRLKARLIVYRPNLASKFQV